MNSRDTSSRSVPASRGEGPPGDKLSLPEKAYYEIKRRILDNEFSSGSFRLEKELAELLDMSRTPCERQ